LLAYFSVQFFDEGGGDPRGAHMQSINPGCRGSPTAMNQRSLWGWSCGPGSLRVGWCRWCHGVMKALPDAMKPREKGLVKTKPN